MSDEKKKPAVVIHIPNDFSAVINKGSEQGVTEGDIYLIYALGPELSDPETGKPLGKLEIVRGRAVAHHVQEKISTLESIEYKEIPSRKKIIKRDVTIAMLALGSGLPQTEEIEEVPQRKKSELGAESGDFAKLILSK